MKTPVVLFIFKRKHSLPMIMERIAKAKPERLYVIADQGRNEIEKRQAQECRELVESLVSWDCELIRDYASENRGVFEQIGKGACRVFQKESSAIFLEDDNLPEVTFFQFCEEMLNRYENDDQVFWVCGTNYLERYKHDNGFYLSHHLTPCGWASWSRKFLSLYDADLKITDIPGWKRTFKSHYTDKRLYHQQLRDILAEKVRRDEGSRYRSWDFHMNLTVRFYNLYSVVPSVNQIKNIGVDEFGTHSTPQSGDSLSDIMAMRFCNVPSHPLSFPLLAEDAGSFNPDFEKRVGDVILYPRRYRFSMFIKTAIKRMLGIKPGKSVKR